MSGPEAPLLLVENLYRHFGGGSATVAAVDGVSCAIGRGEALGLVGESGSGKSTLGRVVVGLDAPTSGRVLVAGLPPRRRGRPALPRQVQMVFQDPAAALDPRRSVAASVTEGLDLSRRQRERRAVELLEAVGLPAATAGRFPWALSGGQCQRVALARALSMQPRLLVADEPLAALDASTAAQMLLLLQGLHRAQGLAYLFIAHDLTMVRHLADRIAVMYAGRFVEVAPTESLWGRPVHPYTRALLDAVPPPVPPVSRAVSPPGLLGEPGARSAVGCPFAPRCPHAVGRCRVEAPALRAFGPDHLAACHQAEGLPPWRLR